MNELTKESVIYIVACPEDSVETSTKKARAPLTCRVCDEPMAQSRTSRPQGLAAHRECNAVNPRITDCIDCGANFTGKSRRCNACRYIHAKATAAATCADCDKPALARGLCVTHYTHWQRANAAYKMTCQQCGAAFTHGRKGKATCSWECHREYTLASEGYKARTTARPTTKPPKPKRTEAELMEVWKAQRSPLRAAYEDEDWNALMSAIEDNSTLTEQGCWEWARKLKDNYPVISFGGKKHQVHRLSLHAKHGKPLGVLAAHHKCANSKCVNPDHLQPVTHRENTAEMLARNSLEARIEELETALRELSPSHEALNRIPVAA